MSGEEIAVGLRLGAGIPAHEAGEIARAWAAEQGLEAVRMEVHSAGLVTVVARTNNTGTNGAGK